MIHFCPSTSQPSVIPFPLSSSQHNSPVPTPCPIVSSSPHNTPSNTALSLSRSSHPSQISPNSSPKSTSSSNSSHMSMSEKQVITTPDNLEPHHISAASSGSHSTTAVSPNSIPYSMSYPTGFQFAHDYMYPDSQSSLSPDTPSHALPGASPHSNRTPNIYINGLPPNFPEQELFALARPYGEVKSVRSFTRHISEKPTGYGFVLFNDVESAERCIEDLRKYRNLHPSFSKQIHRIPGTVYAEQNLTLIDHEEDSFKARMEKLKDESSTNLYIEGLPLSIDEGSIGALMYPHTIKSNRFFKTKLSEPPRMIAFVRLESRSAAEDTIKRLHGRMVRGLNDPGCRISVRFADSAEQRELRRSERHSKNGDQSPARLTMAQAALLSLRGNELQSHTFKTQLNHVRNTRTIDQPSGEIYQPSAHHSYPNLNLASVPTGNISVSTSLPEYLEYPYCSSPSARYQNLPPNCADDLLLPLQQDLNLTNVYSVIDEENEHHAIQRAHLQPFTNATLCSANVQPPVQQHRSQIQARNGFTPAEEVILQAHANLQYQQLQVQQLVDSRDCTVRFASSRRLEPGSKLNVNAQVFGVEQSTAYSHAATSRGWPIRSKFLGDTLTPISEDDFHALAQHQSDSMPHYDRLRTRYREESLFGGDARNIMVTKPPSRAIEIVAPPQHLDTKSSFQSHLRSQLSSHSHLSLRQPAQACDRLATLIRSPSSSQHTYQHMDSRPNGLSGSDAASSIDKKPKTSPKNYLHTPEVSQSRSDVSPDRRTGGNPTQKSPSVTQQQPSFENDIKSFTLVSPALTYSSRTPSTLSPATPFLGSFSGSFSTSTETSS